MSQKRFFLFILFLSSMMIACKHKHSHKHGEEHHHKESPGNHQEHQHHGHNHGHGEANDHMHRASFEDLVERFESPERDAYQQPNKVLDFLGDVADKKILDIGAGTGYFSFKLAARGAEVIAGDVDDRFLSYIEKRMADENLPKVQLKKMPYDSPELSDKEVDKVLIVNTYHHIENRISYFKEVLKGLKEGGELVVIDFKKADGPGPPIEIKMAPDVVKAELIKAGFKNFDINTTLLEHQYIIRAN